MIPSIRSLLEEHQPADREEETHLRRMRLLLETQQPTWRGQFVPGHFTASSFVVHPSEPAILLILHSKLNRWLQPGGHCEPDDANILAAARREVAEEVGLHELALLDASRPVLDLDVHTIPARPGKEPEHEHFDVRFAFRAPSEGFQAGSDALAARWVRLDAVSEVESDASVMRAVAKLMTR